MGCGICTRTVCPFCKTPCPSADKYARRPREELYDQMRPLDLIFTCSDELSSKVIRSIQAGALGHGEFSHVGILVDDSLIPFQQKEGKTTPGQLYFFECGDGKTLPDLVSGKVMTGVQIRELKAVFGEHDGIKGSVVAWARLINNPLYQPGANKAQIAKNLTEFYDQTIGKDYEYRNLHHLLLAVMKNPVEHAPDDTYFCSELVAGAYQRLGLFPAELDDETIAPVELLCNGMKVTPKFEDPIVITKVAKK